MQVSKVDAFCSVVVCDLAAEFFGANFKADAVAIAGGYAAGEVVALGVSAAAGAFDAFFLVTAIGVSFFARAFAVF